MACPIEKEFVMTWYVLYFIQNEHIMSVCEDGNTLVDQSPGLTMIYSSDQVAVPLVHPK